MGDRIATPSLFPLTAASILEIDGARSRPHAKRLAAVIVGALALLLLLGLSWAGMLAGGRGWLIAGAVAGYVAFVALGRTALRLWRADWDDLAPDLRVLKSRSMESELRLRHGVPPGVTASVSARISRFSNREDAP